VVVFAAGMALWAFALRPLWISVEVAPGAYRFGYFEDGIDGVEVALPGGSHPAIFPAVSADKEGRLTSSPGIVLSFSLADDIHLSAQTVSGHVPYLVFGNENQDDGPRMRGGHVLESGSDGPRLGTWNPERPWVRDREWLDQLAMSCEAGDAPTFEVIRSGDSLRLRLGTCEVEGAISDIGEAPALLVISATDSVRLERRDGGWEIPWTPDLQMLVMLLLFSAVVSSLLLYTGWWPLVGSVSLFLWIVSLAFPVQIPLLAAFVSMIAVAMGIWKLLGHYVSRLGPLLRAAIAIGLVWGALFGAASMVPDEVLQVFMVRSDGTPDKRDGCIIMGYSTMGDSTLLGAEDGTYHRLSTDCERCSGRTSRMSIPGGIFRIVRDYVCSAASTLPDGTGIVFVGGNNDEMFWTSKPRGAGFLGLERAFRAAVFHQFRLLYQWSPVLGVGHWELILETSERMFEHTLGASDSMVATVSEAVTCAVDDGIGFHYYQHFLVVDLEGGRHKARQELVTLRRDAVLTAGGTFEDLLDHFGARAGVSWFNDLIHLSAVGHRHLTDFLCETLPPASP